MKLMKTVLYIYFYIALTWIITEILCFTNRWFLDDLNLLRFSKVKLLIMLNDSKTFLENLGKIKDSFDCHTGQLLYVSPIPKFLLQQKVVYRQNQSIKHMC